tara:strand:+ start:1327 stop:2028 length:702 start_codon:yes stop_codon:yes gene_type:complete
MSIDIYNEFYVYAWLKKTGEPYYIGKGKNQRAWRKGSGKVQIIASNLTEPQAFAFEALLIKKLGRKDLNEGPLHNRNDGMIGGDTSKHPNYIKAMKTRKHTPENFGDQSGENNGMFGKGHLLKGSSNGMYGKSREGEKLGGAVTPLFGSDNGMYGRKHSEDAKEKQRQAALKRPKDTEETRKKKALPGSKNGMYGRSAVREKNLKWYTNGAKAIYVSEGTQPNDYQRGRKLWK